jgi:hypothetical protein
MTSVERQMKDDDAVWEMMDGTITDDECRWRKMRSADNIQEHNNRSRQIWEEVDMISHVTGSFDWVLHLVRVLRLRACARVHVCVCARERAREREWGVGEEREGGQTSKLSGSADFDHIWPLNTEAGHARLCQRFCQLPMTSAPPKQENKNRARKQHSSKKNGARRL